LKEADRRRSARVAIGSTKHLKSLHLQSLPVAESRSVCRTGSGGAIAAVKLQRGESRSLG
ncbi:MAG: hypothetical protein ACK6DS_18615, partial [Planctomycetota bacterium]